MIDKVTAAVETPPTLTVGVAELPNVILLLLGLTETLKSLVEEPPLIDVPTQPHICLQDFSSGLPKKFLHSSNKLSLAFTFPSLFESYFTWMVFVPALQPPKVNCLQATFFAPSTPIAEEKGLYPTPYTPTSPSDAIVATVTITKTLMGSTMALDILS